MFSSDPFILKWLVMLSIMKHHYLSTIYLSGYVCASLMFHYVRFLKYFIFASEDSFSLFFSGQGSYF